MYLLIKDSTYLLNLLKAIVNTLKGNSTMKKIITIAFAIFFSFSNLAYAEMRYGISGALTMIDASGTETEGGEISY